MQELDMIIRDRNNKRLLISVGSGKDICFVECNIHNTPENQNRTQSTIQEDYAWD
jgi:hypothetical protein